MSASRLRGDSGAAIVEFALVLPFLALLALGVFEFGMAWRQQLILGSAVRSAARQTTNLGDDRAADVSGIDAFRAAMGSRRNLTIDKLVIYRTTSATGAPVNAACLTTAAQVTGTGLGGNCNIYSWSQIQTPGSNFTATCLPNASGSAWDRWWCPSGREANQGSTNGPDYVGVYVEATYDSYTTLIPTTVTFKDTFVMRIEPKVT